ncbi:MAG: gamma-glutamyl-gamma-aminobutyrate hydrolase family protein [Rickettsiaceae bacterium]|nr:gamma-glutamyl-gamma-aminobutyrate hydrolase family protein [Rickettsiaceae bacterium]
MKIITIRISPEQNDLNEALRILSNKFITLPQSHNTDKTIITSNGFPASDEYFHKIIAQHIQKSDDFTDDNFEKIISQVNHDNLIKLVAKITDKDELKQSFDILKQSGVQFSSDLYVSYWDITVQNMPYLIDMGRSAQDLLEAIVGAKITPPDFIEKQAELMSAAIKHGATLKKLFRIYDYITQNHLELIIKICAGDFESMRFDTSLLTPDQIERLVNSGFTSEQFAQIIYDRSCPRYNSATNKYEVPEINEILEKLTKIASNNNFSLDEYFQNKMEKCHIGQDGNTLIAPNPEILKYLNSQKLLNAATLFNGSVKSNSLELVKEAMEQGYILSKDDTKHLKIALDQGNIDIAEYIASHMKNDSIEISIEPMVHLRLFLQYGPKIAGKIQKLIEKDLDIEKMSADLSAKGMSAQKIKIITNMYDIYCAYISGTEELSPLERDILNPDKEPEVSALTNQNLTNKWGYSALQLALVAQKSNLTKLLINEETVAYQNNHQYSVIELFAFIIEITTYNKRSELNSLKETLISKLEFVDVVDDRGESLIDIFISGGDDLAEIIMQRSNDTLIDLYKDSTDVSSFFNDDKAHVALTNQNFWSTGAWSTARLLMKNYPNVAFHLITLEMLQNQDKDFLSKFDGFINPGAGDLYPKHAFKLNELSSNDQTSNLYQKIINASEEHNIPLIGMCAGAQQLSLNKGGTIEPIKGYSSGKHDVSYIKGTIPYYMALTSQQQKELLEEGIFPEIQFKGDTAHHFAAQAGNIGELELGAVSEDGVPISFSTLIQFATQFHPEHYYPNKGSEDSNTMNQVAWFDNFVNLVQRYHNGEDIREVMNSVKDKMEEWIDVPKWLEAADWIESFDMQNDVEMDAIGEMMLDLAA